MVRLMRYEQQKILINQINEKKERKILFLIHFDCHFGFRTSDGNNFCCFVLLKEGQSENFFGKILTRQS